MCAGSLERDRVCVCVFFFLQAEDGIRDLVRSRGLGDVYKRQVQESFWRQIAGPLVTITVTGQFMPFGHDAPHKMWVSLGDPAVSYTHLTLPTSDLV